MAGDSAPVRAIVVVDLGFGDAGKGLLTDYLVRETGARLVVRYNGGAQAGHHVVAPDGRRHTFAQFGAGTFVEGVRTFLSRHVVVHPTALLLEGEALAAQGVTDPFARLAISERARIITPFQQAAARLRELARGAGRHGSCGVGVGETVADALARPAEAILAGDLADPVLLTAKARVIRERKRRQVAALPRFPESPTAARERRILDEEGVLPRWVTAASRLASPVRPVPDALLGEWMGEAGTVVFEGAQGVLLDERYGFHPYTTWSDTTPAPAVELLAEAAPEAEVRRVGVLRCYAVRHGPGPLPTETTQLAAAVSEHNTRGEWQGPVRYGWFDAVLARYALEVAGPLEALAVTHLDVSARVGAAGGSWRLATGYRGAIGKEGIGPAAEILPDGIASRLVVPPNPTLARQELLTRWLGTVEPVYRACNGGEPAVLAEIETLLERPVDLVSRGPTAADVAVR